MQAFIVMPFRKELEDIYRAISDACEQANVECVRADQILRPGPIINQIFRAISEADCIIAEVSLPNPNVYYEIALAHCQELPAILIAEADVVESLPFDIRHNRVLVYKKGELGLLVRKLAATLAYVRDTFVEQKEKPTVGEYVDELAGEGPAGFLRSEGMLQPVDGGPSFDNGGQPLGEVLLRQRIVEIENMYTLKNARMTRHEFLGKDGYAITVVDALGDSVVFHIDVNGIIRRSSRL